MNQSAKHQALEMRIQGQVQGVGFRPFIWHLARAHGLVGWVANATGGVQVQVCGERLDAFIHALRDHAPSQARIDSIETAPIPPFRADSFVIAPSLGGEKGGDITPDLASCKTCVQEVHGNGRRRDYAFTNCTDCGPRFSIVTAQPYDRAHTSMAAFSMCMACADEYANPEDRRFHAQPIACPNCGPQLSHALQVVARRILAGGIIALKGIGCFHLLTDATNAKAIARLRLRKHRPAKPLALLACDLAMLRRYARVSEDEAAMLLSPAAPIVLLESTGSALPDEISPGLHRLGWMLPATPLHHLLAAQVKRPLVMTSGNISGEPAEIANRAARQRLSTIADLMVSHNRDIVRRLDDSVMQWAAGNIRVLRRSRGLVPEPLFLSRDFLHLPECLAYGAQLKATFCFVREAKALVAHELGDLHSVAVIEEFRLAVKDYQRLFDCQPRIAACDQHPDYVTTSLARDSGLPLCLVQHHHAHMAAVMGENGCGLNQRAVGIMLDGLGYAEDRLCGGEILYGGYAEVEHCTALKPVPLPGGEAAQNQPWRNLLSQLDAAGLHRQADRLLAGKPVAQIRAMVAAGIHCPPSSSAGRLFDAVGCALGCAPDTQSYEAETAMRLESLAERATRRPAGYSFNLGEWIDPAPMWCELLADIAGNVPREEMAYKFHAGLAQAVCVAARRVAARSGTETVALSGGCFHNRLLLELCCGYLQDMQLLTHAVLPPGDSCIALGQALVALSRYNAGIL